MNKLVATFVAAAVVVLGLVGPAASAGAATTPNVSPTYAPTVCDVQVSPTTVRGGQSFTVTVTADLPSIISVTFLDQTKSSPRETDRFVTQFTAPRTTATRQARIVTSCGPTDGTVANITIVGDEAVTGAGDSDSVADADADAGDANGILPGTGGTDLWLLILGALLVLAGVGAVVARRRGAQRP